MRAMLVALVSVACTACVSATPDESDRVLRVCADPNNLPYSNDRLDGFENRIADLVAHDLGVRVQYTWWAQRRGFLRHTLNAGACDLVIGVPRDLEMVQTTRPYYRSSYVFVTRASDGPAPVSFDDAVLRRVRIGIQLVGDDGANPPPATALSRRGIVRNVLGYTVYGDYTTESPLASIVTAVASHEIDVAIVWGPLAGYFAGRQRVPLVVTPVSPLEDGGLPLAFEIAMGVRRGDDRRRDHLDRILITRRKEIEDILDEFHVPRIETLQNKEQRTKNKERNGER